jgi:hypothetical protein
MNTGSIIGNSRVKLTNVADCVKRGLVKEGEDPQKVSSFTLCLPSEGLRFHLVSVKRSSPSPCECQAVSSCLPPFLLCVQSF